MLINESNKNNVTYHEKVKVDNTIKLRELIKTLPPFCKDFFRGIETQTSSRTRIAYAYDLQIFFDYLANNNSYFKDIQSVKVEDLEKLTATDIEEYVEYLSLYLKDGKQHTNDESGLKRKITSLRSFYNYFCQKELIKYNPSSLVKIPKLHDKEIIRLDIDEVAMLLDQTENGEKLTASQKKYHNKTKTRDLAIMTLLLGTGIRVSECVGIDINDIDFNNNGIKIVRKGGNETVIYFGDEVRKAIVDYLEERNSIIPVAGSENALFLSMQKKRISVRAVENLVKKYARTVTTVKKITPHKLRSTYGTNLYQETGDIYLVADVLGHKDVNTTKKHYAAINENQRRSAANIVKLREEQ